MHKHIISIYIIDTPYAFLRWPRTRAVRRLSLYTASAAHIIYMGYNITCSSVPASGSGDQRHKLRRNRGRNRDLYRYLAIIPYYIIIRTRRAPIHSFGPRCAVAAATAFYPRGRGGRTTGRIIIIIVVCVYTAKYH